MEIVTTAKTSKEQVVSKTSYSFPGKGLVRFEVGTRHCLHPDLEIFDEIDCDFLFEVEKKFFYISYLPDGKGNYEKAILSTSKESIMKLANKILKGK